MPTGEEVAQSSQCTFMESSAESMKAEKTWAVENGKRNAGGFSSSRARISLPCVFSKGLDGHRLNDQWPRIRPRDPTDVLSVGFSPKPLLSSVWQSSVKSREKVFGTVSLGVTP